MDIYNNDTVYNGLYNLVHWFCQHDYCIHILRKKCDSSNEKWKTVGEITDIQKTWMHIGGPNLYIMTIFYWISKYYVQKL